MEPRSLSTAEADWPKVPNQPFLDPIAKGPRGCILWLLSDHALCVSGRSSYGNTRHPHRFMHSRVSGLPLIKCRLTFRIAQVCFHFGQVPLVGPARR